MILDVPAALQGKELTDMVRRAETLIIPVLPSPIDIRAASRQLPSSSSTCSFSGGVPPGSGSPRGWRIQSSRPGTLTVATSVGVSRRNRWPREAGITRLINRPVLVGR